MVSVFCVKQNLSGLFLSDLNTAFILQCLGFYKTDFLCLKFFTFLSPTGQVGSI